MAILQISRITQRKGLAQDLPEPLAGAELGWAIDDRRLYIGNGTVEDGAPTVGNTEVLTEFSDLLSYTTGYTYTGDAAGYTVQTGPTTGAPITQSLQTRLDSLAIVTDFGATGDGVTDDTNAINRALYQLYCRQTNTQIRRSLMFPAGTYLITDTLLVPPFAELYGEGADSSIILFQVSSWVTLTAYSADVMVFYAANGNYYRAVIDVPPSLSGTEILPTNTTYWTAEALPSYVVQTVDSLQQTGNNIGTNGATAPININLRDMSFQTANSGNDSSISHNIMLIDRAQQLSVDNVVMQGPFTTANGDTSPEQLSCVSFDSSASLPCKQINFNTCVFAGATYGVKTDKDVTGATIRGSYFDTLYQGVLLESDTISSPNTSPTGIRMVENIFDNIYHEAIVISGPSLNASAYNIFYDVGNLFLGVITTPVIDIDADNNVSIGDMFERTTAQAATQPRIALNNTGSIVLGMNIQGISYTIDGVANSTIANQLQLGEYSRTTGVTSQLTDNSSGTLVVVNTDLVNAIRAFKVDYTITRSTTYRTGTITVVSGTAFTYTDDYSENASTGVTLTVAQASTNVTVSYATTNTGSAGTIKYSITHLD